MDVRLGFDSPLFHVLHPYLSIGDGSGDKSVNAPSHAYIGDAKVMASTPEDVKELSNAYVFSIDMSGLKFGEIKLHVEDDSVMLVSGEGKREEEKEGVKFVGIERRMGNFLRKFVLLENANVEKISATCQYGVLTVTVEKLPPLEPKTIEVKIA